MVKGEFLTRASKSSPDANLYVYGSENTATDVKYMVVNDDHIIAIGGFKDLANYLSNNPKNLESQVLFSEKTILEIRDIVKDFDGGLVLDYLNYKSIPNLNPWSLDNISEELTKKLGDLSKAQSEICNMINDFIALVAEQDENVMFGYIENSNTLLSKIGFYSSKEA